MAITLYPLALPVRTSLFVDLTTFLTWSLFIANLDIVRTETANDTPDVEVTDEDLLLTPTVVSGFSLNDKVWCTF